VIDLVRPLLTLFALAAALLLAASATPARAGDDLIHLVTDVTYDVRPDQGPVRVTWKVSFTDNDPATSASGSGNQVRFFEGVSMPVLRGASAVSASSAGGNKLNVSITDPDQGALVLAGVSFDRRIFYTETYEFTLSYELQNIRQREYLVTPFYVYVPVIVAGDEAKATVNTPADAAWTSVVEPGECAQDGQTFSCSGSEAAYLAAVAEVSRPDATAALSFDVALKDKLIKASFTYIQGEDASAQHARDLAIASLPVIEELYGFPYGGPSALSMAHGGRQAVLGYEGVTSCAMTECRLVLSLVADDYTVLHELAHLWSDIYSERWLGEGFAQIIAEEAALRLPPGLAQGQSPVREAAGVELQLDEWGQPSNIIGASIDEVARENAGYDRSLRFLYILRHDLGFDALQRTNAAIAAKGDPADSKRYMDALEEASGKISDEAFAEWVFPRSYAPILADRRQARDRLATVTRRAAEAELSPNVPEEIAKDVAAWNFDDALAGLAEAESGLATYDALGDRLSELMATADAAGLTVPSNISDSMKAWEFDSARGLLDAAELAVEAYAVARTKVEAPRNLWEQLGLLGSDPEGTLEDAATSFAVGDFAAAANGAERAEDTIDDASVIALRRLFVVALIMGVFALGIGVAVWVSHRREREVEVP